MIRLRKTLRSVILAALAAASTTLAKEWIFIDKAGNIVGDKEGYDDIRPFSEGKAFVMSGGSWFCIAAPDGRKLFDLPEGARAGGKYRMGYASAAVGEKWGLLDTAGKWAFKPEHEDIWPLGERRLKAKAKGKWALLDAGGGKVTGHSFDHLGSAYHEGRLRFEKDGKLGFLTLDGKVALTVPDSVKGFWGDGFNEGVIVAEVGTGKARRFGILDTAGKWAVPPTLTHRMIHFSEGLFVAEQNGKYGFADRTGTLKIPIIYSDAEKFSDGLAKVKRDGRYYMVDTEGKERPLPEGMTDVSVTSEGLFAATLKTPKGRRTAWLDGEGKVVLELPDVGRVTDAWSFQGGFAVVQKYVKPKPAATPEILAREGPRKTFLVYNLWQKTVGKSSPNYILRYARVEAPADATQSELERTIQRSHMGLAYVLRRSGNLEAGAGDESALIREVGIGRGRGIADSDVNLRYEGEYRL